MNVASKYGGRYRILSSGTYGTVYETKHGYAVKMLDNGDDDNDEFLGSSHLREVAVMSHCRHVNIISAKEIFIDDTVYIVMPLAVCDLNKYIKGGCMLRTELVKKYSFQLLSALKYLHKCGIWHRDVKPQNILLMSHGNIKLCDFGISRVGCIPDEIYTQNVITSIYRPPELMMSLVDSKAKRYYDSSADIWSAGVVITELLLTRQLFVVSTNVKILAEQIKYTSDAFSDIHYNKYKIYRHIRQRMGYRDGSLPYPIHDEYIDLIATTLMFASKYRISASRALRLKLFRQFTTPISRYISHPHTKALKDWRKLQTEIVWGDYIYVVNKVCKWHTTELVSWKICALGIHLLCRIMSKIVISLDELKGFMIASINIITKLYENSATFMDSGIDEIKKKILITLKYKIGYPSAPRNTNWVSVIYAMTIPDLCFRHSLSKLLKLNITYDPTCLPPLLRQVMAN